MSFDIPVKVESLSKCYQIYDKPHHRFYELVTEKKYHKQFWALKNISFEVKKGETVGVVGRNGSGKSTLLQIICGTLNPTSGSVITNGKIAALLELGSGFNPEFSGRENIYLNGNLLGLSTIEIKSSLKQIEQFAEIGDFLDQPIKTYSSGMVMRLAFAVQAMVNPDLLIIDEALAVGDERFQRKCFSRIEELKAKGTSILFVSHSGPQIIELCDRAILIEEGECIMNGDPAEVVRSYQRMIYAPNDKKKEIIDSIKSGEILFLSDSGLSSEGDKKGELRQKKFDAGIKFYDPNLIPTSTIRYPERGAKISDFNIYDANGNNVNILIPGEKYKFSYSGEISGRLSGVYFGIHIRTKSGAEISGQRFPPVGQSLDYVEGKKKFQITFEFNLLLHPDTYFVGGGIWSSNPECIHRVLDALMFRVPLLNNPYSFGYCDLSTGLANLILEES